MHGELVELTLKTFRLKKRKSFNNDSENDGKRNEFHQKYVYYNDEANGNKPVEEEFIRRNVHHFDSTEIYRNGENFVVGEYCTHGIIIPREKSVSFDQLLNCAPLISLIKGDEDYLSFLHVWSDDNDPSVVDKQVEHWMDTVSKIGDISETVFAPRKTKRYSNTNYENAIDTIVAKSHKTVVLTRNVREIAGMADPNGVYFHQCGYHLWGS